MIRQVLRQALSGIGVIFVLAWGLAPMAAGTATAAIKNTIKQMFVILNDEELKGPARAEERRQQLEKVIGNRIAYDEMARRSLGSPWTQLNEEERQEFVRLYAQLLRDTYSSRFDHYSDEKVEFLQETVQGDYAEVRTRLTSSKFNLDIDYRMLQRSGDWRVYDIVVDGISLVHSYREQFTKIIRTHSYEGLVAKLRQKTGEIKPFAETANP